MITLDTSAIFALLDRESLEHEIVKRALLGSGVPYLVPVGILSELAYMVETRLGARVLDLFLEDVQEGVYTLDCGVQDLPRIRELVSRYADLPLGFADASVIACAERSGGRTLSLDARHFGTVAREGLIALLPD